MSSLIVRTSFTDFEAASTQFDFVPVRGVVDGIGCRPVDAFRILRAPGTPMGMGSEPAFMLELESPEAGASRYSYVCPLAESVVRTGAREPLGDIDPIAALREHFESRTIAQITELPGLISGAFGYVAYEAIRHFEPSVGDLPGDPTGSPVSAFIFPRELLVFDRLLDQLHIIIYASSTDKFDAVTERISEICLALEQAVARGSITDSPGTYFGDERPTSEVQPVSKIGNYPEMVRLARNAIIDGELIQVVLGQRVEISTAADPIDVYEQLSAINPSPYMYLLDLGDTQLIGASPELMMRSTNGIASVHPIAGTRPRGSTAEADLQNEANLVSNEKESAEHVMLVDLARNDLGRVCVPGTVRVRSFRHVERYSHVMHLVSQVEGTLAEGNDGIDAFEAGFPIGTLSGAPKIRAVQLIAELEPEGRGPYCGGIGWFGANGDVDTGTIIRSIVLRDRTAHVQAGSGIVFDSIPEAENLESLQKAKAPLLAIARAEALHDRHWQSSEQVSSESAQTATMAITTE
ncbi:MAG: chorismate-binding protein [Dehalococcoidia bacterium]|nr:chorismate-binding protein [Dehalococcoidia bacterium]